MTDDPSALPWSNCAGLCGLHRIGIVKLTLFQPCGAALSLREQKRHSGAPANSAPTESGKVDSDSCFQEQVTTYMRFGEPEVSWQLLPNAYCKDIVMRDYSTIRHELVESVVQDALPETFSACLNARGLYNSMQFVLRLSPVVHGLVDDIVSGTNKSWEALQAYSTYLHETVHWWQHVGSTFGFVMSASYPAQAHINIDHLRHLARSGKAGKSLKKWAEARMRQGLDHSDEDLFHANVAVNNVLDIEYFKRIVLRPDLAVEFSSDPYFESVGHSFHITYGNVINLVTSTCDREVAHLPDPRAWSEKFAELRIKEVSGYYYGSPIELPPVGLISILEGQARFIQLQFLSFACDRHLKLEELREDGYLDGVYGDAFSWFLRLIDADTPETVNDPLVALFLLVCDLSINPTRGFPLEITKFERFINDTDPGVRFLRLCKSIQLAPDLKQRIVNYSREEYESVSRELTALCDLDHPFTALEKIAEWATDAEGISKLLDEKATFQFGHENLAIRVLFSHFVAFCQDKLERPDFFCWAGAHMAARKTTDETQALWLRHLSLFSDKADDDGIFPREIPGKDLAAIQHTFDVFYANNVAYDLIRQWVLHDGPFKYDFNWLSRRHAPEEMATWAKETFAHLLGVSPDSIETRPS